MKASPGQVLISNLQVLQISYCFRSLPSENFRLNVFGCKSHVKSNRFCVFQRIRPYETQKYSLIYCQGADALIVCFFLYWQFRGVSRSGPRPVSKYICPPSPVCLNNTVYLTQAWYADLYLSPLEKGVSSTVHVYSGTNPSGVNTNYSKIRKWTVIQLQVDFNQVLKQSQLNADASMSDSSTARHRQTQIQLCCGLQCAVGASSGRRRAPHLTTEARSTAVPRCSAGPRWWRCLGQPCPSVVPFSTL